MGPGVFCDKFCISMMFVGGLQHWINCYKTKINLSEYDEQSIVIREFIYNYSIEYYPC